MARLLSLPFRIADYGAAAANDQGTNEYYREQIATIVLTRRGERILNDNLGMPDVAYSGFLYSAFQAQVSQELPEVVDLQAYIEDVDDVTEEVVVEFALTEENR
jgi:hypothetical protein